MTECLSDEQLDRFLDDGLSDADEQRLSDHIQQCPTCRELLNKKTAIPDSLERALLGDTKGEESGRDTDLDQLAEMVHLAPTVDGVRTGGDTQNGNVTVASDGGAVATTAVGSKPSIDSWQTT